MSDWEPATEVEAAMRDTLRAGDQESYFRLLARAELVLPVDPEAFAGRAPMAWGTWITESRTHVLAFTSPAALRVCLAEHAGTYRTLAFRELADSWPDQEWWLAVNPGLPIEGYLPPWFVLQISRGDVSLPGRTLGARARMEHATALRARAQDAALPGPSPRGAGLLPADGRLPDGGRALSRRAELLGRHGFGVPGRQHAAQQGDHAADNGGLIGAAPANGAHEDFDPYRDLVDPYRDLVDPQTADDAPGPFGPPDGGAGQAQAYGTAVDVPGGFAADAWSGAPVADPLPAAPVVDAWSGAPVTGLPAGDPAPLEPPTLRQTYPAQPAAVMQPEPLTQPAAVTQPEPLTQPAAVAQPEPPRAERPPAEAPPPEAVETAEFTPANEVEEALLEAASEGSTDSFLSTLLLAKVLMPGPGDDPLAASDRWYAEEIDGERYVVVFTSDQRLRDHRGDDASASWVRFTQLISAWPGEAVSLAVNPATPIQAILPGGQILTLATWAAGEGLIDERPEPEASAPEPEPLRHSSAPAPEPGPVLMQKTISAQQMPYYLDRGYDRISGFVHRAAEVAHLRTPRELYNALGLGYSGSRFTPDDAEVFVLRWAAYRGNLYRIPYGGQNEAAMQAMQGWMIERAPFRGNGFAPSESRDVIAEFKVDSVRLPHGAELWRIDRHGSETLIARFDADGPRWQRVDEQ